MNDEAEPAGVDDEEVRGWIRRSMRSIPALPPRTLLAGVQRRIRIRSRGKFFSDGWSTQTRTSQAWLGVITLALVALAFYALGPWALR